MTVDEAERRYDSAYLSNKIATTKAGRIQAYIEAVCAKVEYFECLAASGEYDHTYWMRRNKNGKINFKRTAQL